MAESKKGTSSSVPPKEKSSLLDEEIGKEFLSSWKSMSVTEDDAMDFSFDTVSKGKKNTFNFDKLDMDFNLDGDFDKLSTFKVDMSDLDFSSPAKRTAKPKERSEEESSSGNRQGKQDHFNFSFDFNELDGFNFESSLIKEDKNSNKTSASKGVASSQCEGSKINLAEGNAGFDDTLSVKLTASRSVVTSKVETLIGGQGGLNSINDVSASKSATSGNLVVSYGARTSPGETIIASAEETDQQSHLSEKSMSSEPYAQQAPHDLPVQPVVENDSNRETVPDVSEVQTEICSPGTIVNMDIGGEENNDNNLTSGVGSDHENSLRKISPPLHITGSESNVGERNKSGDNVLLKHMDENEPAEGDLDTEDNSTTNALRKTPCGTEGIGENQSSTSELPLAPLAREADVDTRTRVKEKEAGNIINSKFLKRPEETGPQLRQPSGSKFSSFGKRVGAMHLASGKGEGFNANDAHTGSKSVGNTISVARELTKGKPLLLASEKNVNNLSKIRESFSSDNVQKESKLVGNSQPHDKKVTKSALVFLGSEKNVKDLDTLSLTEKTTEFSAQKHLNPKLVVSSMESLRNSKAISAERNKLCSIKADKRTPDLTSMKISRIREQTKVLSNSLCQREINSSGNSELNMELQGNKALKIEHPVDRTEKQMLQTPSLKRKTFEASIADSVSFKPQKRLSESPSESSNFKVSSEKVLEEQVGIRGTQVETNAKHVFYDHPTSRLESPREVNMMEQEIALVMENDGNVEKAEAYTKELDDICNMLKKKHEEAKEILVRAVVNNNILMMLNHPIYEEKIHKIQKFAAQLMSKELRT